MMRYLLIASFCILFMCNACAQQALLTSSGAVVGTKMVVSTQAPYCIICPDDAVTTAELVALGRKINNMGANVLLLPQDAPYTSANASVDSLVTNIGWRVAELRKLTAAPIFLFAENRISAACLIAATKYFAIKGVVAVSTGEYFGGKRYVEHSLSMLRVPVLSLCTQDEQEAVKGVFSKVPRKLVIFSTDLQSSGYSDLLKNTKQSGKIWLAVSVFYHEHFEN